MKKTTLLSLGVVGLLSSSLSFAQTNEKPLTWCGTSAKQIELNNTPGYLESLEQDAIDAQNHLQNSNPIEKATVLYIPIVFHILHEGGVENISDEQIFNQVEIMNEDFRLLNPDAAGCVASFLPIQGDVEIEFRLATKAPNGVCFNGITRTYNSLSYVDDINSGQAQYSTVRNNNDVYQGEWPGDEYLNVFVCGSLGGGGLLGYTYTPSNWVGAGMDNGIWVKSSEVGEIGTASNSDGTTLTHEAGHWLNLEHIWGGTNDPGLAANCSSDDGVADTPLCIGSSFGCSLAEASCGPVQNTENFMNYSYCTRMFTQGQVTRMRNAIQSNTANRDNVITAANLANTGANGNIYLCAAEFGAPRTTICAGDQITFDDMSYNVVNGWTWAFDGGSPANSNAENPTVTYNTPGTYQVSLTATDGISNDTEVKNAYITVLPAGASIPFIERFEDFTTLTNIPEFEVFNPSGNGFVLNTTFGHTGVKCAKLMNFGQTGQNVDELISKVPLDLSGVTGNITMSFRYSYRKRYASTFEKLQLQVTNNCGESWSPRKTLQGDLLSSIAQNSSWSPSSIDDWTTVHVTNITSQYFVDNFRYKFRFEGESGNNFYLDNINVYYGDPSELLDITDIQNNVSGLSIYPNPTDDELNVSFNVSTSQISTMSITDVTGKQVYTTDIQAAPGSNLVMMETTGFAPGMYFLNVQVGSAQQTLQFIVK